MYKYKVPKKNKSKNNGAEKALLFMKDTRKHHYASNQNISNLSIV